MMKKIVVMMGIICVFLTIAPAENNKSKAVKIMTDSAAAPDTIISLDSTLYLGIVTNVGRTWKGLYWVNITNDSIDRVWGGTVKIKAVVQQPKIPVWYLFESDDLYGGTMTSTYFAVSATKNSAGVSYVKMSNLHTFESDGESGLCGANKARSKALHLKIAQNVDNVNVKDCNNDNKKDVQFAITEANCSTRNETKKLLTFIYSDTGFVSK